VKERIKAALSRTVPPPDLDLAARASLPDGSAARLFPGPLLPAAVLVPLVERPAGLAVLLTRRTEHLREHPGQISFPGGRIDPTDQSPASAALREAHEELGIEPSLVDVAGYLPVHAVVTGFAVLPVVGFVSPRIRLAPDPREVAEAFEVPLAFFTEPRNRHAAWRDFRGERWPVWEYLPDGRRVWGATAHIIHSFTEIIAS